VPPPTPGPAESSRERLVFGIAERVNDQRHLSGAHPVEVDLSLADPARLLERFGLRIGAGDPARNRFKCDESAGSREMGMLKSCRNGFCVARSLPARILGAVLALALA
jgi:hypothetical protein